MDTNAINIDCKQPILDMEISNLSFLCSITTDKTQRDKLIECLVDKLVQNNMSLVYDKCCRQLNFPANETLRQQMDRINETAINNLEKELKQTKENQGEYELNNILLKKANYLVSIQHKTEAYKLYDMIIGSGASNNIKLQVLFNKLLSEFFDENLSEMKVNIGKIRELINEGGGDWERRNKLKVYESLYLIIKRDFHKAVELMLESIATFTTSELIEYKQYIAYTVLIAMISLSRKDIKQKLLCGGDVLETLNDLPHLERYINSYYHGEYAVFFQCLASVEQEYLMKSKYLRRHAKYYIKEMRIRIYSQCLQAYKSVTVYSLAKEFGVSEEFIDRDISKFIALGRLPCIINKVEGIVEITRYDSKNLQYQKVIKQGDILLNSIQKLARITSI